MKRAILLALAAVVCLAIHAQTSSKNIGDKGAFSYTYSLSGGMMMLVRDGRHVRQGTEISIMRKGGEWYVSGYQDEEEQSVKVSRKVAKRVKKMLKKIKWADLHPTPVEGMIKNMTSDSRYWTLEVINLSGKDIRESGNEHEGYAAPENIKKAFGTVIHRIDEVNDYLMGFLTIKWERLKRIND